MKKCPNCKHELTRKAKIDSDDRIYEMWFWCSNCDTKYPDPKFKKRKN